MAYATGTVAGEQQAFDALVDFLKNNATLVANGQQWAQAWNSGSNQVMLVGPGMGDGNPVCIGLRLGAIPNHTEFRLQIIGATGVSSSAISMEQHPGAGRVMTAFLEATTTTYWFVASGRRFMAVFKIGTVYQAVYGGLFLPYAMPEEYPYPLAIGGTSSVRNTGTGDIVNHDDASNANRLFTHPIMDPGAIDAIYPCLDIRDRDGAWRSVNTESDNNGEAGGVLMFPGSFGQDGGVWEIEDFGTGTAAYFGYQEVAINIGPNIDGSYSLTPFTLVDKTNAKVIGILDSVYSVSSIGNTPENVIDVGGVNHLVIPNVQRVARGDFIAIRQA